MPTVVWGRGRIGEGVADFTGDAGSGLSALSITPWTGGTQPENLREFLNLGKPYISLGDITSEDQERLTRGRLVWNTIAGSDKGALSAKQLGADKRVAMWQPDSQVGLVVLKAPEIPKISHPVPLVQSRFVDPNDKRRGADGHVACTIDRDLLGPIFVPVLTPVTTVAFEPREDIIHLRFRPRRRIAPPSQPLFCRQPACQQKPPARLAMAAKEAPGRDKTSDDVSLFWVRS